MSMSNNTKLLKSVRPERPNNYKFHTIVDTSNQIILFKKSQIFITMRNFSPSERIMINKLIKLKEKLLEKMD